MRSTRNDNLLLRTICRCIDRIREVLRMRLVPCDEQQRAWAEFLDVLHQREVEEAVWRRRIPGQRVGVDGARMVSAADVIIVEALHDIRCIRRQLVGEHRLRRDHLAILIDGELMRAGNGLACLCLLIAHLGQVVLDDFALLRRIVIPLIVVADAVRHVVHGRGRDRLDARIIRRCRDGHARETADANGTDLLRVDELEVADEIDCRAVILREDLRRAHIAALAAALPRGRWIEGDGNKAILGHLLCVEA